MVDEPGTALGLALAIGPPVLVALFVLEGLVVGKLVQPPSVFAGYVAAVRPGTSVAVGLAVAGAVAVVFGQWLLFRGLEPDGDELVGVRRSVPLLDRVPEVVVDRLGEERIVSLSDRFERNDVLTILSAALVPGLRQLAVVPAALTGYDVRRFLGLTLLGNVAYNLLLVGIAFGLLEVVGRVLAL